MTQTAELRPALSPDERVSLFHKLLRIRYFEESVERLNREGHIPGFLHTSIGQEATAVGVCEALRADDYVLSTHRGHGHCLAKGASMPALMAELYGKVSGQNRGKGGSMHVAEFGVHMLGADAMVGGGLGMAVGAALSSRLQGTDRVAVAFFGEGAATNGTFHESMNLAATLRAPAVFVCENNLYAHEAPISKILHVPNVADLGSSYGVERWIVDGNDVQAVLGVAQAAVAHSRQHHTPTLVEAKTYRHRGHHGGDPGRRYRPVEEIEQWLGRDPISRLREELAGEGIAGDRLEAAEADARREVDDAIAFAEAAAYPEREEALEHLFT